MPRFRPDPCIELVIQDGCLKQCFAIDAEGMRVVELPITESREVFSPSGPGIVSIDLHSFRVKRTEQEVK